MALQEYRICAQIQAKGSFPKVKDSVKPCSIICHNDKQAFHSKALLSTEIFSYFCTPATIPDRWNYDFCNRKKEHFTAAVSPVGIIQYTLLSRKKDRKMVLFILFEMNREKNIYRVISKHVFIGELKEGGVLESNTAQNKGPRLWHLPVLGPCRSLGLVECKTLGKSLGFLISSAVKQETWHLPLRMERKKINGPNTKRICNKGWDRGSSQDCAAASPTECYCLTSG